MPTSRSLALALAVSVATAGCAAGPGQGSRPAWDERVARADPARVIAVELAFARAAQEKGQWTAFAEYAANEAVMFVPEPVLARTWLRRQTNPAQAVRWQPHQVWSSCDGSLAVTRGAWQRPDDSNGYFTTVWVRQRDGSYRWVMDQGNPLNEALEAPEMIEATVSQCAPGMAMRSRDPVRATVDALSCDAGECRGGAVAADGSLSYQFSVDQTGEREVIVQVREDGTMREVLRTRASG